MSKEIDHKVIQFMEMELEKGHFEHTLREISKGTGLSYNDILKGVERLKTRGRIAFRNRGSNKKPTPYYYLFELKEKFGRKDKKSENVGKRNISVKAKKQNPDICDLGGD